MCTDKLCASMSMSLCVCKLWSQVCVCVYAYISRIRRFVCAYISYVQTFLCAYISWGVFPVIQTIYFFFSFSHVFLYVESKNNIVFLLFWRNGYIKSYPSLRLFISCAILKECKLWFFTSNGMNDSFFRSLSFRYCSIKAKISLLIFASLLWNNWMTSLKEESFIPLFVKNQCLHFFSNA